jgi:ATPase subunit of ABC transporter with duplicated ATPase domains
MPLITLRACGLTLGKTLFSGLDLIVEKGDRIGLVAPNGRGKTRLLRMIAERQEPTEGACIFARNLRVALMEQELPEATLGSTMRDFVSGALAPESRAWEAWRVDAALDALEVPATFHDRALRSLSGGWQRVALLARATIAQPQLLLMDEPTNHLDLGRIGVLERHIADLPGETAVLVASHDRAFLDAVTNRTLFLRETSSAFCPLPYRHARASLAEADAAIARRQETDLKQAAQLRRQAAKLHNIGVNSGSDLLTVKTKQLRRRAERIEAAARPAHSDGATRQIRLAETEANARFVLRLSDATVSAPDGRVLFGTGKLWVRPGDRVVVLGANGAGKSMLLHAVARAMRGDEVPGIFSNPSNVAGICDQRLSHLRASETLHDAIGARFEVGDQRIRALLAGAGFAVERQARTVAELSGGERARLALLMLRLQRPNVYVLDEPTNHLDIEGQELLEGELQRAEAACLIVSHDRQFVANVGTRFWLIAGQRLIETDTPEAFFATAVGDGGAASRGRRHDP